MELAKRCLNCGAQEFINIGNDQCECVFCHSKYEIEQGSSNYEIENIVNERQMKSFARAVELCDTLIEKNRNIAEANWQKLLSELGVVYVNEEIEKTNGEMEKISKPTFFCHDYVRKNPIYESELYKKAIANTNSDLDKYRYKDETRKIDNLLKLFDQEKDEYDIFISFKSSRVLDDGEKIPTRDSIKAKEIYDYLTNQGFKVFFSPVSIGENFEIAGEQYEPKIWKAIATAKSMIVLGSKKEFLDSNWVKNEWSRYQYFINQGVKQKNSLILGYETTMPSLPVALKDNQYLNFDWYKGGYLKDIEKILSSIEIRSSSKIGTYKLEEKKIKKREQKKEHISLTELAKGKTENSVKTNEDRILDDLEKELKGSESVRNNAIKNIKTLVAENSSKKLSGKLLMLDMLVKCNIDKLEDFSKPENLKLVMQNKNGIKGGLDNFKQVIENAPSKKYAIKVIKILYDNLLSCEDESQCYDILNSIISYDLNDGEVDARKEYLLKVIEKATSKIWCNVFDLALKNLSLSADEDIEKILSVAKSALINEEFFIANNYAQKILDDYEDGNVLANEILLLAKFKTKSFEEFFGNSILSDTFEDRFDGLKNILEYMSAEDRKKKLVEWDNSIILIYKNIDSDNFYKLYDRFLQFFEEKKQIKKIQLIAEMSFNDRKFFVASHYFDLILSYYENEVNDKIAEIYWKKMLCDYKCINEIELYEKDDLIEQNINYKKAYSISSNELKDRYVKVKNNIIENISYRKKISSFKEEEKVKLAKISKENKKLRKRVRLARRSYKINRFFSYFFLVLSVILFLGSIWLMSAGALDNIFVRICFDINYYNILNSSFYMSILYRLILFGISFIFILFLIFCIIKKKKKAIYLSYIIDIIVLVVSGFISSYYSWYAILNTYLKDSLLDSLEFLIIAIIFDVVILIFYIPYLIFKKLKTKKYNKYQKLTLMKEKAFDLNESFTYYLIKSTKIYPSFSFFNEKLILTWDDLINSDYANKNTNLTYSNTRLIKCLSDITLKEINKLSLHNYENLTFLCLPKSNIAVYAINRKINYAYYSDDQSDDFMFFKKFTFDNGDYYYGEWKDYLPYGSGNYYLSKPDTIYNKFYEINFEYSESNKTKVKFNNSNTYEFNWKDGLFNGQGKYIWKNGAIYEGEWKNGEQNGYGKYTYADGEIYEGEWKDGKKNGYGKYTYADGDVYEGEWKDSDRNGHGKMTYLDGDIYEGEWKNGNKDSQGKYIWKNGNVYEGNFKDGLRNGYGKMTYANGIVKSGQWKDDKYIG